MLLRLGCSKERKIIYFLLFLIFFGAQFLHLSFASKEPEERLRERNTAPEGMIFHCAAVGAVIYAGLK